MSGLVAFTGPPDRALLDRMLKRLSHRGTAVGEPIETPWATVAVCEWPNLQPVGKSQTECFATPEHQWAISGFLLGERPEHPADIRSLLGSFAAACVTERTLTIARDPTGCQSLYYGQVGLRWLIGTEPKCISGESNFERNIRPASLAQYLAFSFVPGRHTMLEDLFEAEAGHTLTFSADQPPKVERHFQFETREWQNDDQASQTCDDAHWIAQTRSLVADAVRERMPSDRDNAVFLSGGLDSSIIAAEVAKQSSGPIRTYSLHFGPKYANELEFAKSVADRIGSRHEEVLIRPKHFLPRLREMIWHLDEPIGDPITQPNFELAQHVGQNSSYAFNGEGGDPLFGGPKNIPMMLTHWYGGVERPANFREQAYLASYRRAYEEWTQLLSEDFRRQINPVDDLEHVLSPYFQSPPQSFLNKLMAINIRLKGANLILPKVDRMLAASGLTPLSPLFDDRLVELSFRMPPKMKLRAGIEKYALKQAYAADLPQEIIDRPKSGMRVPVHFWFQRELRSYARDILSKKNIRRAGIFDADRIQKLLRYETEEGPGRYGLKLWMLLTFEIWRRIVVEGEAP